jgi:hypothetical protein
MPIWFDPSGRSTYGLGLCARCSRKMSIEDLFPDPNAPGLMVCVEDLDVLDPYRLPARQTEQINLPIYRPDVPLTDNLTSQYGTGIPPAGSPGFPVFNILAQRLVDGQGRAILDANGKYIDLPISPGPLDLP